MTSRIKESEIRIAALKLLAASKTGTLTTTQLIDDLEAHFRPGGMDSEIINGRKDTYFSQKVRNLVCHRDNSTSLERKGFAEYDATTQSWSITSAGIDYIDRISI